MAHANVNLSKEEMDLVKTPDFILTKNRIIGKVMQLMGTTYDEYLAILKNNNGLLQETAFNKQGKIFKGEQYEGLPYVTLDYPRNFSEQNILAIRSFFWWGNFFSITLHISGDYAQKYFTGIYNGVVKRPEGWFICINQNAWHHHFKNDNYIQAGELINNGRMETLLKQKPFIKIARKIELEDWEKAVTFFTGSFNEITGWLKN